MDETAASIGPSLSFGGLSEFLGADGFGRGDPCSPGTRLGDVTLVRLIGEGGMGRVFEGWQDRPQRSVAVKLIRAGLLSAAAAKRFEHETQILGRLSHPAIAQIHSAGIETIKGCRVPFFVMELVEGGQPLTQYASRRDLGTRERVSLFRAAVAAVAHGHQRGIVHRDLKPGNILVAADGQPKVIDFGVARGTDGDVALTTVQTDAGQLIGTLQYMSPEQFAGNPDELDIRADVYSLGIVLYELLAGRPPYDTRNRPVHEVARLVVETDPQPLSSVSPRLRGDLTTIVTKCLEKDRTRRYSSAAELEADLGQYLRGEPIMASPPGLADALRRLARRHRAAVVAALGIAVALVLGTIGTTLYAVRANQQRQLAVAAQAQADAAASLATQRLYTANMRALKSALATKNMRQARLMFEENATIAGSPAPLELRCLAPGLDEAVAVLHPGNGPVINLAWTDAGQLAVRSIGKLGRTLPSKKTRIIERPATNLNSTTCLFSLFDLSAPRLPDAAPVTASDPQLLAWRAALGDTAALADLAADAQPVALSPTGDRLVVRRGDGSLAVVDRQAARSAVPLAGQVRQLRTIRFLAAADRIIAEVGSQVLLWNASDGQQLLPNEPQETVRQWTVSPDESRLAIIRYRRKTHAYEHRVEVLTTATGKRLMVAPMQFGTAATNTVLALSPTGDILYSCSNDRAIERWETASGRQLAALPGHRATVTALMVGPAGRQLASGSRSGHVRLWDTASGRCLQDLLGHDQAIHSLAFAPAGDTLASGSRDGTVRLWKPELPATLAAIPLPTPATTTCFSPDGRLLAIGTRGQVELWDAVAAVRLHSFKTHGGRPTMIAFSPSGSRLAVSFVAADGAGETRVWQLSLPEAPLFLRDAAPTTGGHWTVCFSPDETTVLTTTGLSRLAAWSTADGTRRFSLKPRGASKVFRVPPALGLGGSRLAYLTAQLFDANTGKPVAELNPHAQVTAVATSPDGRLLATGLAVGSVLVDDLETGERLTESAHHAGSILATAISPDGRFVAAGSEDGAVQLWEIATPGEPRWFLGHEGQVAKLLFTPDGQRLITASDDGTVRIWQLDSGQELLALPGSGEHPETTVLSPAGDRLVTVVDETGERPAVRIWGLANAEVFKARLERQAAGAESGDRAPPAFPEMPPDRPALDD